MEKERKDFPFEIKSDDIQESGIFKGYGSMFGGEPDSYGDIVMKGPSWIHYQKAEGTERELLCYGSTIRHSL